MSPVFKARKWLDNVLMRMLPPGYWSTLYSMVTFSNIGYATVRTIEIRQKRIITGVGITSTVVVPLLFCLITRALRR